MHRLKLFTYQYLVIFRNGLKQIWLSDIKDYYDLVEIKVIDNKIQISMKDFTYMLILFH